MPLSQVLHIYPIPGLVRWFLPQAVARVVEQLEKNEALGYTFHPCSRNLGENMGIRKKNMFIIYIYILLVKKMGGIPSSKPWKPWPFSSMIYLLFLTLSFHCKL